MLDLSNYKEAIHPDCGKVVEYYKDITITPFYTEDFCDELVDLAKRLDDKFTQEIVYKGTEDDGETPWNSLYLSTISQLMFENFCRHYKAHLLPVLEQKFEASTIFGWWSPFIIKYDKPNQKVNLHNDPSHFTMNVKLNTDFEGCELEFPRQGWSNKDIPKGWCFVWPSSITHPHQAKPLISGAKYTLASWTHPNAWDPNDKGGSFYPAREDIL